MTASKRKRTSAFDGVTLDQLRLLVTVVDEGSFSAAARRVGSAQSAVSQAMASLESYLGFKVWDRTERTVTLTERGHPTVAAARRVLVEVDRMRDLSEAIRVGRAERLTLAVDALFPTHGLVSLAIALKSAFPGLTLRLDTDTLGSIGARVARRECDVGIAGPLATSDAFERVAVGSVLLIPVAAASHPLALVRGRIANETASAEVQIVLSEHGAGTSPDQGVLGSQTWRVADLSTKRELILGGLGWGNLPEPLVREDLQRGSLVRLELAAWTDEEHRLPLALIFPPGAGRRPIVRWLVANVPLLCASSGVGIPGPTRERG
jgi:DNA-binding transcriptional LysR family regulator